MDDWTEIIEYRVFNDVPRLFITQVEGRLIFFDGHFEDELDEYPDEFKLYDLEELSVRDLPIDWSMIPRDKYLGTIAVMKIVFDESKRKRIKTSFLREMKP